MGFWKSTNQAALSTAHSKYHCTDVKRYETLEASIVKLQELVDLTGENSCLEALSLKKTQLSDLVGGKAQGALVRSRFQNIDQLDAPTKFFFNLEKRLDRKK